MVYIESAFYGDEKSTKNVTQVLKDKIQGNKVVVDKVDDKLIPAYTVAPKGDLTTKDVADIRKKAEDACGGSAADQNCVKLRTSEFTQQTLREKAQGEISEGTIIKGKRLTVRIRGDDGKIVEKVVPENGKLEVDGLSMIDPRNPRDSILSSKFLTERALEALGIAFGVFLWVFSVAATYTLFSRNGWGRWAAIGLAVIAAIVPGSGYLLIAWFFGGAFYQKYVALSTTNGKKNMESS
jgi:hypothetical protein